VSKTYISAALRREVIQCAGSYCEYCLTNSEDRAIVFAIDHIIAEKHGGSSTSNNLSWSCYWCNSFKGSDLSSVDWDGDSAIVPLFNPRQQQWADHFRLEGLRIVPLTATGRVTVFLLQVNAVERIKERRSLVELGVYPCKLED
jgi:hypothetical protein